MIRVDLDNDAQIAITAKGLERALEYRGQWEGKWKERI